MIAVRCDVRDEKLVQAAVDVTVQHFGQIDILLIGAAGNFLCRSEDLSVNALRTGQKTNQNKKQNKTFRFLFSIITLHLHDN